NEICSTCTYHVYSQYFVRFSISKYFYKTISIHTCTAASQCFEWETTRFVLYTCFFKLLFCFTYSSNFRPCVNNTRYKVIVNMWFLSGNGFSNKYTFFLSFVSKHGTFYYVTNSINVRRCSLQVVIHLNLPAVCKFY